MAKAQHFYGIHAVQAILSERGTDASALWVQDGRQNDASVAPIIALADMYGISVQIAGKDALTKLADSPQHQGVVLQARPKPVGDDADLAALLQDARARQTPILLLLLDQITDPNNLGACLRTAVAMGVTAVVVPKHHTSSLTPAVAKIAVGAAELMPLIQVTNLACVMDKLKQDGVFVYGTALDDTAKPLAACDLTGDVALVMGSEGEGIRRLTAERCDQLVYIPMVGSAHGSIQSLNVSVATGMVLYEACRQRLAAAI
ncbi:23S rRNA (guanosine(2251)-2'-O)-methyltransferase RlmB [Faucicola atlantae]|uniref:23S rRNA (guanosine(2251)-2'-O)-methyltransferase RlmB n=1 Tax=Faucicola atlantae TaxID=34059 RepID=UPI0025B27775|nr:23S rRNA (guanosine(2251)-2'-O)-methyltransferase RlmB [Moraxella atlantae]